MSRLSCVHVQTFVRSCPDHRAFTRPSCVHVQTIVRSCPDHRAFIRVSRPCNFERTTPPSCVHFGLDISGFGLGTQPGKISAADCYLPIETIFTEFCKRVLNLTLVRLSCIQYLSCPMKYTCSFVLDYIN